MVCCSSKTSIFSLPPLVFIEKAIRDRQIFFARMVLKCLFEDFNKILAEGTCIKPVQFLICDLNISRENS